MQSKNRWDVNSYIHIHTWHNDWGRDSVESHERHDYCRDCAKQVVSEYISKAKGTEGLELENKYLFENEEYEDFIGWASDAQLACKDY